MVYQRGLACSVAVCMVVLIWFDLVQARPLSKVQRITKALSHPSFKVRLQAAILIGKQKLVKAAPALRKALDDQHDAVKAAAVLALGKLGDETSRSSIATLLGHKNMLIFKTAEKALVLLDRARNLPPSYLVAIDRPVLPSGVQASRGKRLVRKIIEKVRDVSGLVLEAGETSVLQGNDLAGHLAKRHLTGIVLQPKLVKLDTNTSHGQSSVFAQVSILLISLQNRRIEYDSSGEANAWIEDTKISEQERSDMENTVLDASLNAALEQVLGYLARRGKD